LDGPGAARGTEQAAEGVVHRCIAPGAHDFAVVYGWQARISQGGFQVARRGEGVGSVVTGLGGRDERAHGLVRDRALGAFGRGEQAGYHPAARPGHPGRLAQRPPRVAGKLKRVDAGHRVEGGVAEGQRLHVGFAQVGVWEPAAGDAQQTRADVQAGDYGSALPGQNEGETGSAAHVEDAGARADAGGVEDGLEQRGVVRLGQVCPSLGVGAPQAALDFGGGTDHGDTAGLMFWLSRKTLSGS
jgi:hypothetical protein